MSTSSAVRSKIASYEAITSPNGTGSNVERTRSDANLNKQQSQRQRGPTQNDTSTTTAASQSRISRIRQQQLVREGKAHNTTNLIEKRKQMKERRKMQEMRAAAKASATNRDAKIEGSRTEYIENSSTQRTNRSNNNPVSSSTEYAETAPGNSRMSKMQRMQKMKVYDHIKRGQNTTTKVKSSRVSTSSIAASSVVAGSAITAATTAVARNYPDRSSADKKKAKARRRHQQAARALKSEAMESPPASPVNKNNVALSPSGNESLGTDVFSESNYTNGATDASVDPVTDDEVTLTSVRRIVSRSNQYSPGNQSHQYQELQPSANRHTSEGHSKKSKKKSRHESRAGDSFHNPISLAAGRDGASLPSQPPGPYTRNRRNGDPRDIYRDWLDEEKSDKAGTAGGVFRTASSSDYDTDGDISKTSKASRQSNALGGPSQSQATDVNDFFTRSRYGQTSRRMDDDERTFDYGDRDDDSNGSASYATRRRKEAERRAREAAAASVAKGSNAQNEDEVEESPLINKDDVEHYTKSLDTPAMKMGAGIVGAATVGCIVLGPVGLLVGAAAVGVGVGVMQIPQQKRTNIQKNAQKALNDLHDKAIDASESISNSCGAAYKDSGVADHLPPCFPAPETVANDMESTRSEKGRGKNHEGASVKGAPKPSNLPKPQQENGPPASPVLNNDRPRNKKVACLRNVRILSAGQIHGLQPEAQPRAWLEVVASANTIDEEKNEAMEEILFLAKDKRRARIFLDEGILDSIIWTLSRYFEKVDTQDKTGWVNPEITPSERTAVKIAAVCCVMLGKAHCAAIHTEGDLLLMSLYERGTVPEERQVAQMLHEVPHHARITKTADPSIVDPSKEVFALKQLSLPQAEELARSIKAVADAN